MSKRFLTILGVLVTLSLVSMACAFSTAPSVPAVADPNQFNTAVVQTVNAQLTQQVLQTLIVQLTQAAEGKPLVPATGASATLPPGITPTAVPTLTNTLLPSSTPPPTHTPVPTLTSTRTPVPIPCYRINFIADVNIADGTVISPSQSFTKTWRLENNGSCTWTTDFELVYIDGTRMNAPESVSMPATIRPGDTVDVSVSLKAPASSGTYRANFKLRSSSGVTFGLGQNADRPFYVEIAVETSELGTWNSKHVGDFAYNYCEAIWYTQAGNRSCPSSGSDFKNGSITKTNAPVFEGGHVDDEPTLITIPNSGSGGYITGHFPALKIKDGDHFTAVVGCLNKSPKCDVTFQLFYAFQGESSTHSLGSWHEVYDSDWTNIDVDLSDYADDKIELYLRVKSNDSSVDDRAFWMAAKVAQ